MSGELHSHILCLAKPVLMAHTVVIMRIPVSFSAGSALWPSVETAGSPRFGQENRASRVCVKSTVRVRLQEKAKAKNRNFVKGTLRKTHTNISCLCTVWLNSFQSSNTWNRAPNHNFWQ